MGRLLATGQVKNPTFVRRMKKINTDQVYRQKKFNLCNEMSEGFCKLITLYTNRWTNLGRNECIALLRVVGGYDLDPSKVQRGNILYKYSLLC